MTEELKPVGSGTVLSAQMPAGLMRGSRMRPRDPLVSSCLPEPRCQQALPGARAFDLFASEGSPPQGMIWPPGWVRPCLGTLFPRMGLLSHSRSFATCMDEAHHDKPVHPTLYPGKQAFFQ